MGNLNPLLRDTADFTHKLWDHLFIMSDFQLDVDSPYPRPSREELTEAEEVGERIADAIAEYFADETNRTIIRRLRAAGIRTEEEEKALASAPAQGTLF